MGMGKAQMLEGFKAIAAYISDLRGRSFSADCARKAVDRPAARNPLPMTWEGGRAIANRRLICAWNEIETGRRARRSNDSLAA